MPAGKHLSGKRSSVRTGQPGSLSETQARRLRVTCQHVDRVLCEIENILDESASGAAFPSYVDDISPAQREIIVDYMARIRARLVETLERQEVDSGKPEVPVSRAIRGRMYTIDIAAEEIKPRRMKGYGTVSPQAATELERFTGELQELARYVDHALRE